MRNEAEEKKSNIEDLVLSHSWVLGFGVFLFVLGFALFFSVWFGWLFFGVVFFVLGVGFF